MGLKVRLIGGFLVAFGAALISAPPPAYAACGDGDSVTVGTLTGGNSGTAASTNASQGSVDGEGDGLGPVASPVIRRIMAISYTVAAFGKFEDANDVKSASNLIAALTTASK
ncbi:MAG: hypothetical protein HOB79_21600 [Rhodospirillaceae bacterium]|jgi:hypothetical protein|nr:hypothetical protein [Rhodospirillales bacterium]MBT3905526.1 hypothetical protein [Rhodospirillaceae bacterium]MBT4703676.1 hypothetical protein [Rhodospirillaceae bacterium]MBT5035938.1 hypothetical protein [Rhodospirillaceae bacterium]MBT6220284.1 hypothetical protein [Rhodospirillaceae bacterium]